MGFHELRVTVDVTKLGLTGYKAADWLRGHHDIAVELADHRRLMAAVSHADTEQSVERTLAALADMAETFGLPTVADSRQPSGARSRRVAHRAGHGPRDAFYADAGMVTLEDASGRVAAEFVTPYPPRIRPASRWSCLASGSPTRSSTTSRPAAPRACTPRVRRPIAADTARGRLTPTRGREIAGAIAARRRYRKRLGERPTRAMGPLPREVVGSRATSLRVGGCAEPPRDLAAAAPLGDGAALLSACRGANAFTRLTTGRAAKSQVLDGKVRLYWPGPRHLRPC
jgi:hypothetical protein